MQVAVACQSRSTRHRSSGSTGPSPHAANSGVSCVLPCPPPTHTHTHTHTTHTHHQCHQHHTHTCTRVYTHTSLSLCLRVPSSVCTPGTGTGLRAHPLWEYVAIILEPRPPSHLYARGHFLEEHVCLTRSPSPPPPFLINCSLDLCTSPSSSISIHRGSWRNLFLHSQILGRDQEGHQVLR